MHSMYSSHLYVRVAHARVCGEVYENALELCIPYMATR